MRVIWICEFKANLSNVEQACLNKQTNNQALCPEEVSFEQMYTNFHDMLSIKSHRSYHPPPHQLAIPIKKAQIPQIQLHSD